MNKRGTWRWGLLAKHWYPCTSISWNTCITIILKLSVFFFRMVSPVKSWNNFAKLIQIVHGLSENVTLFFERFLLLIIATSLPKNIVSRCRVINDENFMPYPQTDLYVWSTLVLQIKSKRFKGLKLILFTTNALTSQDEKTIRFIFGACTDFWDSWLWKKDWTLWKTR